MRHTPPLADRDGISPSYIWLPEGRWDNLLHFLTTHFPAVDEATWLARINKNEVVDADGTILSAASKLQRGMCIFYYREIEQEAVIPFSESILFQDAHLLVVDKPHFLPTTPGGRFLRESLLVRLKNKYDMPDLTPIHRLDRETAGVILFSHHLPTRGKYQSLFQHGLIQKTYHAIAPTIRGKTFPLTHRSRMVDAEKFFIMQEVSGEPNSETLINIIQTKADLSLYELRPLTGKKHQLRLHMASLGAPILNDAFYPIALPCKGDDYSQPLQLLAKSICFIDPMSGAERRFCSEQQLFLPE